MSQLQQQPNFQGTIVMKTMSDVFWKFIRENVGIARLTNSQTGASRVSKNKKVLSLEERQERIDLMRKKTGWEDDKLDQLSEELEKWSPQALELSNIVKQIGLVPDLCYEEYIQFFFKELSISSQNISSICPSTVRFSQLKVLNLSFNYISTIENLPPNLEELYLNGNQVDHLAVTKPMPKLYHLGLNRNRVRQLCLT